MVIKPSEMKQEIKENMRGGEGKIEILNLADPSTMKNARLLSKLTIRPGCSIGNHEHLNETEYYIITAGRGVVLDNSVETHVSAGDLVVTGGGASHSIRCEGTIPLELFAVIITY